MATAVAASPPTARAEKMEPSKLERKIKWFRAFETNKSKELEESRIARQYYHDKQWTDTEVRRLRGRGQQDTTRNRISFCETCGEPPRIMLTRPNTRTIATAPIANGTR